MPLIGIFQPGMNLALSNVVTIENWVHFPVSNIGVVMSLNLQCSQGAYHLWQRISFTSIVNICNLSTNFRCNPCCNKSYLKFLHHNQQQYRMKYIHLACSLLVLLIWNFNNLWIIEESQWFFSDFGTFSNFCCNAHICYSYLIDGSYIINISAPILVMLDILMQTSFPLGNNQLI